MKRIFHPYHKWEDYKHNFYGGVGTYEAENAVDNCANMILGNLDRFEGALYTIITQWKYACEHNLTNENMNRIAYLGQAACALVLNVPSSVSMGAYNKLSVEQQKAADALAQRYLDKWLEGQNVNS